MMSILWILIYVALFYFMFRYGGCCGGHGSHGRHGSHGHDDERERHEDHSSGTVANRSVDPVCGMTVSENDAYSRRYNGRVYRFCSRACLDRFEAEPNRYVVEEKIAS
jgi:YHS domain-containing protein